jgi:hypothetical protein
MRRATPRRLTAALAAIPLVLALALLAIAAPQLLGSGRQGTSQAA